MARKSPVVNTGCTWPMFRIFHFSEGHSKRRLVSGMKHLNTHASGNGNLRSSSDVISTVDEKHTNTGVSSRRRYCSCKSIRNMENHQVADPRNEVTKMIVDQRFVNKNYQGKNGAGCQPNQLLDALLILYSNKELFLKLLKDPNSLLVKQIHDLPSSQVKQPYQARSHSSFSCNVQNTMPSHLHFGRIKRKLRYVMKVRRKKQKRRTTNGVPYKFICGCKVFEDCKKVVKLETAGRNSLTYVEKGLNSSLDLKRIHKVNKVKDSKLCTRQEEATSLGESFSRNTNNTANPSEQDILNIHVEGRKSLSEMLNFGIEDSKQCTNSVSRTTPLPDFESLPRYCGSVTEGIKCDDNNQMKFDNDPPWAIVKTPSENLQLFGSDISIRSIPHGNLQACYGIPRDDGFKDTPTQNFGINNATGGIGSLLNSHPEIQSLSFSPEVASSSPSPSQRTEDNANMRNRIEHPSTESAVEQFTGEDVTTSQRTILKPDESPGHDNFEENHFEDLIRSSLDLINNLTSSKDTLDYVREILHALSLKWDELFMNFESSNQMLVPSTFDQLNGLLTGQLSSNKILLGCVIETFMEVYQSCCFPPKSPDIQAYVVKKVMVKEIAKLLHSLPPLSPITLEQLVEKDLEKRGSWLNIQVGIEDIVIEVEEDVLEKLVLEIVFEMDIRSIDTLQRMSSLVG